MNIQQTSAELVDAWGCRNRTPCFLSTCPHFGFGHKRPPQSGQKTKPSDYEKRTHEVVARRRRLGSFRLQEPLQSSWLAMIDSWTHLRGQPQQKGRKPRAGPALPVTAGHLVKEHVCTCRTSTWPWECSSIWGGGHRYTDGPKGW